MKEYSIRIKQSPEEEYHYPIILAHNSSILFYTNELIPTRMKHDSILVYSVRQLSNNGKEYEEKIRAYIKSQYPSLKVDIDLVIELLDKHSEVIWVPFFYDSVVCKVTLKDGKYKEDLVDFEMSERLQNPTLH